MAVRQLTMPCSEDLLLSLKRAPERLDAEVGAPAARGARHP